MHITSLHIYPIKGCAGTSIQVAEVTLRGLAHDRRWLIVEPSGQFLTQRTQPTLALVRPQVLVDGGLRLSAPGQPDLVVAQPTDTALPRRVQVWSDTVDAVEADAKCGVNPSGAGVAGEGN